MDKHILSEFAIPDTELGAEMTIGDYGKLTITVEVMGRVDGCTLFRKHKKAVPEGNFKPEGAKEMRERIIEKEEKYNEDGE